MIIIHYITRQNQSIGTYIKSVALKIYLCLQWICQMMDAKNMLCKARAERAFGGRKMSGSCSCSTRKIWATKIVGNLVLVMSCCYWILGWRFLEMSRKISIFFLHKTLFDNNLLQIMDEKFVVNRTSWIPPNVIFPLQMRDPQT